jgi:hypothetical protein
MIGQIELDPHKALSLFQQRTKHCHSFNGESTKGDGIVFVPPAQTRSKNCQIESLLIVPLTSGNDVGAISIA